MHVNQWQFVSEMSFKVPVPQEKEKKADGTEI